MEELNGCIKSLENDVKVLNKLHSVKNQYLGDSVEVVTKKVGITKMTGYMPKAMEQR